MSARTCATGSIYLGRVSKGVESPLAKESEEGGQEGRKSRDEKKDDKDKKPTRTRRPTRTEESRREDRLRRPDAKGRRHSCRGRRVFEH